MPLIGDIDIAEGCGHRFNAHSCEQGLKSEREDKEKGKKDHDAHFAQQHENVGGDPTMLSRGLGSLIDWNSGVGLKVAHVLGASDSDHTVYLSSTLVKNISLWVGCQWRPRL